jgi:glycosyltransferase involved in cell wall biosynthesis
MRAYRSHDVLVVSSVFEGFGMVLLEAMSQGLPPVSTPVGCAPQVVRDGETGILVPARDSVAQADAVVSLLDDSERRRRIGAAAREAVRGMTWAATASRTIEAYEAAIEQARR